MAKNGRDYDLFAVVAVGGACGALVRFWLETVIKTAADGWPRSTFVVNLSGCLVLGSVLIIARYFMPEPTSGRLDRLFRPFVVTGVLGGYTTFSTYAVETHALAQSDKWAMAAVYAITSIVIGVLFVWIAMRITEFVLNRAGLVDPASSAAAGSITETREAAVTRESEDEG